MHWQWQWQCRARHGVLCCQTVWWPRARVCVRRCTVVHGMAVVASGSAAVALGLPVAVAPARGTASVTRCDTVTATGSGGARPVPVGGLAAAGGLPLCIHSSLSARPRCARVMFKNSSICYASLAAATPALAPPAHHSHHWPTRHIAPAHCTRLSTPHRGTCCTAALLHNATIGRHGATHAATPHHATLRHATPHPHPRPRSTWHVRLTPGRRHQCVVGCLAAVHH